ncbi:aspartyl-phosphate phosphatase Spo0E family protein [Orenia marismortui]|uniref:Spo0E like sporulation regulatory protein n=1 Tax=Orenia marismortui TaxID=46469 RepID=A0A4R8GXY5_9FIRM|nr:aspartyl-phosphate phosphatase Spo0E family protein [Orenia marismortui]TDX51190.1 Spo0E like sporulation regulatory protein [Orenia marismortui]
MNCSRILQLSNRIDYLKEEMDRYNLKEDKEELLELSQKLDELILEYMKNGIRN